MQPFVLLILDGWGIAPKNRGNAIELAKKPNFDFYWDKYPHTMLFAHGKHVGVPVNQVGNSEAGHLNIGAGRLVVDDAVLISQDIKNGKFFKNLALLETIEHVQNYNSSLHLMGLATQGTSPHGNLEHLYAIIDLAWKKGVKKIYLHLFTDGRDSPQFAALKILKDVERSCQGRAKIVSVIGRYFSMDRGKNWLLTKKAYDCLTRGSGLRFASYHEALIHSYNNKETDEFVEPSRIAKSEKEARESRIGDDDAIVFFNLRSDRARQLAKCFVQHDFNAKNPGSFKRLKVANNLVFCALTDFGPDLDHILTAYPAAVLPATLPRLLKDKRQLYIAETEKYAHITYFINGGSADPVNGEDRVRIPSFKIKSYDLKPQMSVYEITKQVMACLKKNKYDFYAVNFANPDMVGHTGNLAATIKAIEHVDLCLKEIAKEVQKQKGTLIITADHGNAEKMIDLKTNEVWTEHTTNKVPFILVSDDKKGCRLNGGKLGNIAPTIYDLLEYKKSPKILDKSLLRNP